MHRKVSALETIEALGGILLVGVLLWDHFQPNGPKEFLSTFRGGVSDLIGYHRAMRQTLADIEDLPEFTDTTDTTRNEEKPA